jgi:23S rRNA pseudouridine2605 synthase
MNDQDPDIPVPAGPSDTEGDAPRRPRRRRPPRQREAADGAVGSGPVVSAESAGGEGPAASASTGDGPDADAAGGDGASPPPGADGAGEGQGQGRGRNRRRKRGGDRGDRGERGERANGERGERNAGPDRGPRQGPAPVPLPPAVIAQSSERFAEVMTGAFDEEAAEGEAPADAAAMAEMAEGQAEDAPEVPVEVDAAADDGDDDRGDDAEDGDDEGTEAEGEDDGPGKRVLAPEPDAPKLHKVLAQGGIGSRRDMEQLILEGRITVNHEPAHIGQRISFGDQVRVNGKLIKVRIAPQLPRVLAYHKPVGEVVSHDDPQQRPTVFRRLPRLPHGKWQSVGRLDINTEGLLLFTNSGELANQLMHPRFGIEREYAVRVLGELSPEARQQLLDGVDIDGQKAQFKSIEDGGGEGANRWVRVVIAEGRNREVRKLFDAVGLTVSRLIRIRYGSVVLPRGLKRGVWVELGEQDLRAVRRLAGNDQRPGGRQNGGKPGQGPRPGKGQGQGQGKGFGPQGDKPRHEQRRGRDKPRGPGGPNVFTGPNGPAGPMGPGGPNPRPPRERRERDGRERDADGERIGPIPNPLQQTYDKRALQQERQQRNADRYDDEDGPIPNPLQQTYDRRFVQNPPRGPGGPGGPRGGRPGKPGGKGGKPGTPKQPDPLQTAVGYIGADAFLRRGPRGGRGGGGGGGGGRGPGGRGR